MRDKKDADLQALVGQATAGDKKALAALLLSVQDTVFNLSLRMLGTFGDAEDAAQTVFRKVMERTEPFRDPEHEKAWLIRVAANHCKDVLRFRFRHPQVPIDLLAESLSWNRNSRRY